MALPVLAQRNTEYRINTISSNSGETIFYTYENESSTLPVSRTRVYESPDYSYANVDTLTYNESGQIVRMDSYSKWDDEDLEPGGYTIYTYNDKGQRVSEGFYYDGALEYTTTYTYDENGLMTSAEDIDIYSEESEKAEYSYNEEGLRIEDVYSYDEGEGYIVEEIVRYVYENGLMVKEEYYEFYEGEEYLGNVYFYEYDEHGNCILEKAYDDEGNVDWKREYHHDMNISNDIVHYYNDPDDYVWLYPTHNNMITGYTDYLVDENGEMQVNREYEYTYDEIVATSVAENSVVFNIYPNPVEDVVNVEVENSELVELYDVFGRKLYTVNVTDDVKIDMSDFADGVYFVKVYSEGSSSVKRIVKK